MNFLIERLNLWGERFLDFAWPMLWQSSLLIVVLFALDFALRRKVRAGVRYALWLVVMVKLLLPPTLAVPTSIAWWVRPSPPPKPQTKNYIVTYFNSEQPQTASEVNEPFAGGAVSAPEIKLSSPGWSIVASGIVSLGLLTWMILRWRHVARLVRCASPATEDVTGLLNDAKRNLGLRRGVQLRLTNEPISPAVCGLFRPVILLPRSLAEQLPPRQLRAVLLHELAHLKRGDVWLNCAQALLQIAYWWHPLLWLANARIRRVREEAVDDAVMLALRDEAESYAPTLLEVAKLAFNRPLAALGLVGIMESRSSLRQRIERLMDFRPPGKVGLTFASVFCVVAFGTLAVPMGEPPVRMAQTSEIALPKTRTAQQCEIEVLGDGSYLFENTQMDLGRIKTHLLTMIRVNPQIKVQLRVSKNIPLGCIVRLVDVCKEVRVQSVNSTLMASDVAIDDEHNQPLERAPSTNGRSDSLLNAIPKSLYENPPGPRFEAGYKSDLLFTLEVREDGSYWVAKKRKTLAELRDWLSQTVRPGTGASVRFEVHTNAPAESKRALSELCKELGVNENYKPPAKARSSTNLLTRTFKFDTNTFNKWLQSAGSLPVNSTNTSAAVRAFLASLGVDFTPDSGKSFFFTDRSGLLMVRATKQDLDKIESSIQVLNAETPQVNIKVKFVEVPSTGGGLNLILGSLPANNTTAPVLPGNGATRTTVASNVNGPSSTVAPSNAVALTAFTGILTEAQYQVVLRALEQRDGVDLLTAAEVTTPSGRQAQVQIVNLLTVTNGINPQALAFPGISSSNGGTNSFYETDQLPFGLVLDVIPTVSADGFMVNLKVIPTVTEFLGYNDPKATTTVYVNGQRTNVTLPLPIIRSRQTTATANIWDGQTLVLGGLTDLVLSKKPNGNTEVEKFSDPKKKQLFVFVTPTIVDPRGIRVHAEEEMPFAREGVPPQRSR